MRPDFAGQDRVSLLDWPARRERTWFLAMTASS
jgi:hypothetical protein